MIILLMGPQGAGKGTQGEMLSKEFDIPVYGTGALLREEIASGSELGLEIEKVMNAGNLVSPDLATRIIAEKVTTCSGDCKVVIDGYPRDAEQLRLMSEKFVPDVAIVLEIDDETGVERLGGRWMCPSGHIWNSTSHIPKVEGICDFDGDELFQRDDDTRDAILKRLGIYRKDTEPLIEGLADLGVKIVRIDARESIEKVGEAIVEVLGLNK